MKPREIESLMAPQLRAFDTLLAGSQTLLPVWSRLEGELLNYYANSDKNFLRRSYKHIDHGPDHWASVRSNADLLWTTVCSSHKDWMTAENAFILSASAYLHDVAMVHGYHHVDLTTQDLGEHLPSYFRKAGIADDRITRESAQSPIGHFVLRYLESWIAEKVIQEFSQDGYPLKGVEPYILKKLSFIVRHYKSITDDVADKANDVFCESAQSVLAMAAVLQFSDWAHLDNSRVDPLLLDAGIRQMGELLTESERVLSARIDEDGGDLCCFPKIFRSHYVFDRKLSNLKLSTNPTELSIVKYAFRLSLPKEMRKSRGDSAYMRLTEEWRSHFYPNRMHKSLVDDHLNQYAGVQLLYLEPEVEQFVEEFSFRSMPPFVRDFFSVCRWFDLSDATQFLGRQMGKFTPDQDIRELPIDWNTLHSKLCVGEGAREFLPTDKPRLSRRALIYIHATLTRGHPILGDLFFRQLQHEVCKLPVEEYQSDPQMRTFVLITHVKRTARYLRDMLMMETRIGDVFDKNAPELPVAVLIGRIAFPFPVNLESLLKAGEEMSFEGNTINSAIDLCVKCSAVNMVDDNKLQLSSWSKEAACLALLGSPFFNAIAVDGL